jgi:hypothetical protein
MSATFYRALTRPSATRDKVSQTVSALIPEQISD